MSVYEPLQLDALKEVGNIGSGNAATLLSLMLKMPVTMAVTDAKILSREGFVYSGKYLNDETTHIVHKVQGDINGSFCLIMSESDRKVICNYIAGDLGVDDALVMEEISNILCGNYLNTIAKLLSLVSDISPPESYCHHSEGNPELISRLFNNTCEPSDRILFVFNNLSLDNREIGCSINLVLDDPSMKKLMSAMGI